MPPAEPTSTRPRVAVVCNPGSGGVAGRLEAVRRAGRAAAGELYRETDTPGGLDAALAGALEAACDVLCLVGGDGTVQLALTALEELRPREAWPTLAAAPGGTANMTATDLGARGSPAEFLGALSRWRDRGGAGGALVRRPALRVEGAGSGRLAGMFFGAGVVAAGVRYFQRRLDRLGVTGEKVSALAVGRVLLGLAFGGETGEAAARPVAVSVDGGPETRHEGLLCLASTLDRLLLGTRPYWGRGDGPIHFTLVERGARGLWRSLPRLAMGRPGERLTPERGYRSADARRVELALDGPFVLDGELYRARAEGGPLRLSAPRTPEWLVP